MELNDITIYICVIYILFNWFISDKQGVFNIREVAHENNIGRKI